MINHFANRTPAILIWAAIAYFFKFIGTAGLAGVSMACVDGGACGSDAMLLFSVRYAAPYVIAAALYLVCVLACLPVKRLEQAVGVVFSLHLCWVVFYFFSLIGLESISSYMPSAGRYVLASAFSYIDRADDFVVPIVLTVAFLVVLTGAVRLPQQHSPRT